MMIDFNALSRTNKQVSILMFFQQGASLRFPLTPTHKNINRKINNFNIFKWKRKKVCEEACSTTPVRTFYFFIFSYLIKNSNNVIKHGKRYTVNLANLTWHIPLVKQKAVQFFFFPNASKTRKQVSGGMMRIKNRKYKIIKSFL